MNQFRRISYFVTLVLAVSNAPSAWADARGRISLAGTGFGYASDGGYYVSLGAIYEIPFDEQWMAGLGVGTAFSKDWLIYGPQGSLRYFFEDFRKDGWLLSSIFAYRWINYKDARNTDSRFSLAAGPEYQWVFESMFLGLGLVLNYDANGPYLSGVVDLGFTF
jgi:hypothetical protein